MRFKFFVGPLIIGAFVGWALSAFGPTRYYESTTTPLWEFHFSYSQQPRFGCDHSAMAFGGHGTIDLKMVLNAKC